MRGESITVWLCGIGAAATLAPVSWVLSAIMLAVAGVLVLAGRF